MFYSNSIFRVGENVWCAWLITAIFVKMIARVSADGHPFGAQWGWTTVHTLYVLLPVPAQLGATTPAQSPELTTSASHWPARELSVMAFLRLS